MRKLGQTIRDLRIKKELTIEDFAFQTGITSTHIGCIERGKKENITVSTLEKISASLDLTPYQLLAMAEYYEELDNHSCPLKNILIECHRCEKSGNEALTCRTQTSLRAANELLTISNFSHLQESSKKRKVKK